MRNSYLNTQNIEKESEDITQKIMNTLFELNSPKQNINTSS